MADLDELAAANSELEEAIGRSSVRGEHLFSDLAALGFGRDVLENSRAVYLTASSEVPRALYPSARAAFEALFELIFLLESDEYDLMGCRARVAELFEHDRSIGLAQDVLRLMGREEDAYQLEPEVSLPRAIEDEARSWDGISPGKGELIKEAYSDVLAMRKLRKFSWHGMSRMQLHKAAAPHIGGGRDTERMIESWYQFLSVQSHPAPRIDSHNLQWREDGTFVLGTPDDQKEFSIGMGAYFG